MQIQCCIQSSGTIITTGAHHDVLPPVESCLQAAFISSYLHSSLIFAVALAFSYTVYTSSSYPLGSLDQVWKSLIIRGAAVPVAGNKGGSLITMFSSKGLQFGWIFFASCFGWVWADQGFWQSAIAARPSAAYKGYILGGLLWFAVPYTLSTCLGLGSLALDLPLSTDEVSKGLVPPAIAYYLFGKGGVVLITVIVFMAVTSSGSAEFLAVSSLFSYDIWKTYVRPRAQGGEILMVSRLASLTFGLLAGVFCIILLQIGISINWLFFVIGLMVASVFPPISFLLCWNKVGRWAAITAALGGQGAAILAWLVATYIIYGDLTITTTSETGPALAGNIVAIVVSASVCVIWTLIAPDDSCDWDELKARLAEKIQVLDGTEVIDHEKEDPGMMKHAAKMTWIWAIGLTLLIFVLWPLLTLPAGIFSRGYFSFWIGLAMTWGTAAAAIVIFFPLIQGRQVFINVLLCRKATAHTKAQLGDHHTQNGVDILEPPTPITASKLADQDKDSDTSDSSEGLKKG